MQTCRFKLVSSYNATHITEIPVSSSVHVVCKGDSGSITPSWINITKHTFVCNSSSRSGGCLIAPNIRLISSTSSIHAKFTKKILKLNKICRGLSFSKCLGIGHPPSESYQPLHQCTYTIHRKYSCIHIYIFCVNKIKLYIKIIL